MEGAAFVAGCPLVGEVAGGKESVAALIVGRLNTELYTWETGAMAAASSRGWFLRLDAGVSTVQHIE